MRPPIEAPQDLVVAALGGPPVQVVDSEQELTHLDDSTLGSNYPYPIGGSVTPVPGTGVTE